MPLKLSKNMLIIKLECKKKKQKSDSKSKPNFVLKTIVNSLKWLGYKVVTVKEAMAAESGKFACLTLDGSTQDEIVPFVRKMDKLRIRGTIFVPTSKMCIGRSSDSEAKTSNLISWRHLKKWRQTGWEIGALSHEPTKLTDKPQNEQEKQIKISCKLLAEHLGEKPISFSYPHGAYDSASVKILRENGYRAGVGLDHGINLKPKSNPLSLSRISLDPSRLRSLTPILKLALEGSSNYKDAS